jgi:hypothetical protein
VPSKRIWSVPRANLAEGICTSTLQLHLLRGRASPAAPRRALQHLLQGHVQLKTQFQSAKEMPARSRRHTTYTWMGTAPVQQQGQPREGC